MLFERITISMDEFTIIGFDVFVNSLKILEVISYLSDFD